MNTLIPVSRPYLDKEDRKFIIQNSIIKANLANSHLVDEFEKNISKFCERRFGIAVTSGTVALDLAIKSFKLKPKSKVIIPNFSIVSVLNAVINNNLTPVFIDVDEDDYNINFKDIENLPNIKSVKAAILVSTYNSSSDMEKIINYLKKFKIKVIEDAAESFGGYFNKKKFGSFGDVSILSFYPNKIITTGEGGMLLTNNNNIANFCKNYRNLFFNRNRDFLHKDIGSNLRFSSILASLGLSQFKKINKFKKHRKILFNYYKKNLNDNYFKFQRIKSNIDSAYWVCPITIKNNKNKIDAKKIISLLEKYNIQSRMFFSPLSKQPFLNNKFNKINSTVSDKIYKYGLYLPLGNGITLKEVKLVVSKLNIIAYEIFKN